VLFEFQHELATGEWESLGLSRSADDDFDIAAGVAALRATLSGTLPSGSYRVRSPEGESRWRYAAVDPTGEFRLVDE
jgi:hypothetical protein